MARLTLLGNALLLAKIVLRLAVPAFGVLVWVSVGSMAVVVGSSAEGISDSGGQMTKDELLLGVRAERSRIKDIAVSFTFNAVKAPSSPAYLGFRMHVDATAKGSKAYIARKFGADPKVEPELAHREVAFNGERTTTYQVKSAVASIRKGRDRETETHGVAFFDMAMLNPSSSEGNPLVDQDLESLLAAKDTVVRLGLETVNERPCQVVDLVDPERHRPLETVWIDVERGFLPMKQVYYSGKDLDSVAVEFVIDEAVELQDALWLPTKGTKRARMLGEGPKKDSWQFIHVMQVDSMADGRFTLQVNAGVPDEFFDLWKRVPPGTRVADMDVGTDWYVGGTVGRTDYRAMARDLESSLTGKSIAVPERTTPKETGEGHGKRTEPGLATASQEVMSWWKWALSSLGAVALGVIIWAAKRVFTPKVKHK